MYLHDIGIEGNLHLPDMYKKTHEIHRDDEREEEMGKRLSTFDKYLFGFLSVVFLIATVFLGVVTFADDIEPTDNDEMGYTYLRLKYGHMDGHARIEIPMSELEGYENSRMPRRMAYVTTQYITPDDTAVRQIADVVSRLSEGMSNVERVNMVNSFIYHSVRYTDDTEHGTDDYYQYPMETIYYGKGDCEDMAFLEVSVLRALGYDAVPILSLDHCLVGVNIEGDGKHMDWFGRSYYYLEPTSTNVLGDSSADGLVVPYTDNLLYAVFGLFILMTVILSGVLLREVFRWKIRSERS